jgi:hypothetical protein
VNTSGRRTPGTPERQWYDRERAAVRDGLFTGAAHALAHMANIEIRSLPDGVRLAVLDGVLDGMADLDAGQGVR